MKFNININQKGAFELGLNLDEVILITCIHDLIGVSKFEKNEKHEVFITQSTFIKEYPLLPFKSRTTFFRRFNDLEEKGFITKTVINLKGNKKKTFYGLTSKSDSLFFEFANVSKKTVANVSKKTVANVSKCNIDNNTIDNNNIDNNIKNLKKDFEIAEKVFFKNTKTNELFIEYLKTRPKKKNTELSIKRMINKCDGFTDEEIQEAINLAIEAGYQSIFPKKGFNNSNYEAPKWEKIDVEVKEDIDSLLEDFKKKEK